MPADKQIIDEELSTFRTELLSLLDKSREQYQKQLSWISSGSIGVSMIVIEKIFPDLSLTDYHFLLALGWILLSCTLFINLVSHLISFHLHSKTIAEINSGNYSYENAVKRNWRIQALDWISVAGLFLGLLSVICFIINNL